MDQKTMKVMKSWFGVLFGMIFLIIGLAAGYSSSGGMISGYLFSSNWIEVPATIKKVELVRKRSKGNGKRSSNATIYSVLAEYSYSYKGISYNNDRVSLSCGSDNIGSYWQDLASKLKTWKRENSAVAIINSEAPGQSLLDRTLRWRSVVFGSMFTLIFGGAGGVIVWFSLRGTKTRERCLQLEFENGISSNERHRSKLLAVFGSVLLMIGGGISLVELPDEIRNGNYIALVTLVFPIAGAAIIYASYRMASSYRKFGPSPLFLDPLVPGVGGQLGGRFKLNVPGSHFSGGMNTQLHARLLCSRKTKSGKNTSTRIIWHNEAPVYIKETAHGIEGSFLFDISDDCDPTKEWSNGSSISWSVVIEGELNTADRSKLKRSWQVDVEEQAAQASNVLNIPQSFLHKANKRTEERANAAGLKQVPVTEDSEYIYVHSKAGRNPGQCLFTLLLGCIFAGVGMFAVAHGWWPGYIFLTIGVVSSLWSIYKLGSSIHVKIQKNTRELSAKKSLFGIAYAHSQGTVFVQNQFTMKKTAGSEIGNKITEYYAIYFDAAGSKIRIAESIEGKNETKALLDTICSHCFREEQQNIAA